MTTFTGNRGVSTYTAIVLKSALSFYAKTGMKVNSAYTPTNMLVAASRITGMPYKRGQYQVAILDLEQWLIEFGGMSGELPKTPLGKLMGDYLK